MYCNIFHIRDCRGLYQSVIYSSFVFLQGKAGFVAEGSNNARDSARAPLFSYVNENKLKSIDTYARK